MTPIIIQRGLAITKAKWPNWELLKFHSNNMNAIIVYFKNSANGYDEHNVFLTEEDRKAETVTISDGVTENADKMQVWMIGENRYGRLTVRRDIEVID